MRHVAALPAQPMVHASDCLHLAHSVTQKEPRAIKNRRAGRANARMESVTLVAEYASPYNKLTNVEPKLKRLVIR